MFLRSLRSGATLLDVFRKYPEASRPLLEFHEILLRGPSPFTPGEREMIAAYVSGLNRCRYCHDIHSATAERLGAPTGFVDPVDTGAILGSVPEKMRPVLRYAERLTRAPAAVTQANVEAILAAGWNETAIYHTVAVTALFNLMNRLVEGLGIELDPAYVPLSAQRLADRGYRALIDMLRE